MEKIEINKTFNSQAECDKWEEENLPERTYKGRTILCVNHECNAFDNKVKLTSIMVF